MNREPAKFEALSPFPLKTDILVGGFNPSEKYLSNGSIIPNIWNNKKMFQTKDQYWVYIPKINHPINHVRVILHPAISKGIPW